MLALTALGRERCQGLVGVVFDVDDTLTREGRLEREAYDALWGLADAGLRLVAVTGRPLGWAEVMAHLWPIDLAVGENGAGWVSAARGALHRGFLDASKTRDACRAQFDQLIRAVDAQYPAIAVTSDDAARRCDLAFDISDRPTISEMQVGGLVSLIEARGFRAEVSSIHAHASLGNWDKARGVVAGVAHVLGIDMVQTGRERWLFVGDSGNDASAFAFFPETVGVANVREHLHALPSKPQYVTQADRGAGFAELAAHVLSARQGS